MLSAQYSVTGTESAGLAGCYTSLSGVSAVAGNQAGLGWEREKMLSAEFSMPFMMKELGIAGLAFSLPMVHGNLAGKLTSAGIPGYHDNALWVSYGLRVQKNITAGAGLFYNLISIKGKPVHQTRVSFAGGIQVKINSQMVIGGHILYPLQYNSSEIVYSRLQSQVSFGCSYEFFKNNRLYGEFRMNASQHPVFVAGVESVIGNTITFRGGILTHPTTFSIGTGFLSGKFHLLFASHLVYQYGLTSFFGIGYEI